MVANIAHIDERISSAPAVSGRGVHMNNIQALQEILEKQLLTPLFQPVVSLRENAVHGYEALIRGPSDSPLHSPLTLFDAATRNGQLAELELLCRQISLEEYLRLGLAGKLFLNISPAYLMQPGFRHGQTLAHMRALGIPADRVVMELTEHSPTHDYGLLRAAAAHYKDMGFEIAIDDLGAGYAGLRLWHELRPNYVKIDMHFVQGIHEDRGKRQFVESIREIALSLNCHVIAEGVETRDEYRAISELGIDFGQGYYFARPGAAPPVALAPEVFLMGHASGAGDLHAGRTQTAGTLIVDRRTVDPATPTRKVGDMFYAAMSLNSVPVVRGDMPVGLVRRTPFMHMFASRYGRELYGKKPIAAFMDRTPLIVDKDLPLEKLSKLLTKEAELHINDDFIITDNGRYAGVGTVMRLLQKITELQIHNARYANPLTLLPGTVPINERLDALLQESQNFTVCYCDLDNFKPFNDAYGYSKGDEAIRLLAQILVESGNKECDFVGHIGGDDFLVIFLSPDWEMRCQTVLRRFEREVIELYGAPDKVAGGLWSKGRRGEMSFYSIMSLSIGAVEIGPRSKHSHHDIATMASNAKILAKSMEGNALFVDRRQQKIDI